MLISGKLLFTSHRCYLMKTKLFTVCFLYVFLCSTGQEAALAMASLRNTHLYGRHLVLEWAKEEDEQEGDIQGLEGFNLGGTKRSAATAAALPLTALDKLRKKARQDERVIHMQSEKRAGKGVQDMLEGGNGGVGSDDV